LYYKTFVEASKVADKPLKVKNWHSFMHYLTLLRVPHVTKTGKQVKNLSKLEVICQICQTFFRQSFSHTVSINLMHKL